MKIIFGLHVYSQVNSHLLIPQIPINLSIYHLSKQTENTLFSYQLGGTPVCCQSLDDRELKKHTQRSECHIKKECCLECVWHPP